MPSAIMEKQGRKQAILAREIESQIPLQVKTRAKAFSRWFLLYRKDVLRMSQVQFGNYIQEFVIYLLKLPNTNLTEMDKSSARERLAGELTEMGRNFAVEERYSNKQGTSERINEAWVRIFMLFCVTGDVTSSYNIFDYLDTNDDGRLPKNAWTRKDIPLIAASPTLSTSKPQGGATVEPIRSTSTSKKQTMESSETTISHLLRAYVREEMSKRGTTQDSVLRSLADQMNEDGENFVRMELEFVLNQVDDSCYFGRVRSIVRRFAEMEVFTKKGGEAYSVAELLSLPLGFELIKEENQRPLQSR